MSKNPAEKPYSSEYQTRQRRACCRPCGKEFRYAVIAVPFWSKRSDMRVRFGVAALLLSLPAWCAAGWAQLAPSPDAPPVSTAPAQASGNTAATLKVNVNLVDVFFTVKDENGRLVPHLTRDDCTVSEDQAPQKLKSFTAETSLPLTLGILLDTSGSQYRVLAKEQEAGASFWSRC